MAVTVQDVRELAVTLPRSSEHLIRDRVRFRVGAIVYCGFSRDEELMGFGFPKEQRLELVAAEPEVYLLPPASDLRFHWVLARTGALELEVALDHIGRAWRMVVPKFLVRERFGT